jgi:hypothetical protein
MPVAVDTSGRIYDDFIRLLLFLHSHREEWVLSNELPLPFIDVNKCWGKSFLAKGRINFTSFVLLVTSYLILNVSWVDFGEIIGHEDFYTARPVISVFYTTTSFHSF